MVFLQKVWFILQKPSLASFEVQCEKESNQEIYLNENIDGHYEQTDLSKEEETMPFFPKE